MPSVHILKTRAASSFASLEFNTYNEAVGYRQKMAALNPSKPYKRIRGASAPVWCVTVRKAHASRAEYVTFPSVPGFTGLAPACRH